MTLSSAEGQNNDKLEVVYNMNFNRLIPELSVSNFERSSLFTLRCYRS